MVAAGTPIRLIHENGDFTELDATSITLETVRKANSSSIPFGGGGRYNFDLNLQNAEIMIDGIFTDDSITFDNGVMSKGAINCYYRPSWLLGIHNTWIHTSNMNRLLGSAISDSNLTSAILSNTANRSFFTLTDILGNKKYIVLVRVADNASLAFATVATITNNIADLGTKKIIKIVTNGGASDEIRAQSLATAIKSIIDSEYSSQFTAELKDDDRGFAINRTNVIVEITHTTAGANGNGNTPNFTPRTGRTTSIEKPDISNFRGGEDSKKKSAGDKVQDFYGIINNSRRTGGLRGRDFTIKNFRWYRSNGENDGFIRTPVNSGDYIVGVQIPFNSMINAGNGTYVARNFHMPTGRNKSPKDKGAEGAMVAGTKFSETDKSTGIQGFVKKFSVDYDAGETVYKFKMVFLPVDWMF